MNKKPIPLISKWTKRTIMVEALMALDEFESTGSREGFKRWQVRWEKELKLIDMVNEAQLKLREE